jgi:hypothetical protein
MILLEIIQTSLAPIGRLVKVEQIAFLRCKIEI